MLASKHIVPFSNSDQKCRYCHEELTVEIAVPTNSYWQGQLFFCHEGCKKQGEAEERIACQIVDADCNDCFFFQRGAMICKGTYEGRCKKFDKIVRAYPVFCSDHPCFEHRAFAESINQK